jgi:polysaccharide lyase-like protein
VVPRKLWFAVLVVALVAFLLAYRGFFGNGGNGGNGQAGFVADFESGLTPWKAGGGGAQCANYGTPSGGGSHYRGDFFLDNSNVGQGATSGRFVLAAQSTYPLEVCDIITGPVKNTVGTDGYYGLMVYTPTGFSIGGFGDVIEGLHFVNVYAAPINLVLRTGHLAIDLESGPCTTSGCAYRNGSSCTPSPSVSCLAPKDVIPSLNPGQWYEIITHVHWASDPSGLVETWYRPKGATNWAATARYSGIPTQQWKTGTTCCVASYIDEIGSYTSALQNPLTIWLDNQITASSFSAVATTMP